MLNLQIKILHKALCKIAQKHFLVVVVVRLIGPLMYFKYIQCVAEIPPKKH